MLERLIQLREYHLIAISIISGLAGGALGSILSGRLIAWQIVKIAQSVVDEATPVGGEFRLQMGRYHGKLMKDVSSEYLEFLIHAMPNTDVSRNAEICLNNRSYPNQNRIRIQLEDG